MHLSKGRLVPVVECGDGADDDVGDRPAEQAIMEFH